ncbi:12399_t:CDS:2 [Entrophospora sp. SA101]|nr:12399_t:CDS:2 [Entrophospora sp. SA101]
MFTELAAPKDFRGLGTSEKDRNVNRLAMEIREGRKCNLCNQLGHETYKNCPEWIQERQYKGAVKCYSCGKEAVTGWKSLVEPRVQEPQNYNTSYSYMIESLSLSNNSICSPPTMENMS